MPAQDNSAFLERLTYYRDMALQVLREWIPTKEPDRYLYGLVREHLDRSGKGLRPALCLATCRAFGGHVEDALNSAAAIELIHNAFLVHDDIEDGSEFRRTHRTMHTRYGVPIAVNTGDAMQALSMRLLRKNLPTLGPRLAWQILDEFDHMLTETLEGQAMELGWIRDNQCEISDEDYLRMTLKKTCWYSFIHPCRIGALIARPKESRPRPLQPFWILLRCSLPDSGRHLESHRQPPGVRQRNRWRSLRGEEDADALSPVWEMLPTREAHPARPTIQAASSPSP